MKANLNLFAVGLAGCLSFGTFEARASLEVSVGVNIRAEADFYEPLGSHGAWVTVGSYGRCWRPAHVAVEWRPYCYGHWVWTDCGWYWESDEPWAWACYHYGYWVYDSDQGWLWIPGVEWAPAWVSWRVGGGYIGWAPYAPPHVKVVLGAPHFVFVQTARFHEPLRPSRVVVNNTTIINQTTVINNIKREDRTFGGKSSQKVVINEGPGVDVVRKASGRKFETVKIQEAARRTAVPKNVRERAAEPPTRSKVMAETSEPPKVTPERIPAPKARPSQVAPPAAEIRRGFPPGSPRQPWSSKPAPPVPGSPKPGRFDSPTPEPPAGFGNEPPPKQKGKKAGRGHDSERGGPGREKP